MDAATAALVGAAVGCSGAVAAAWLNPFTTARQARRIRNFELRREAYERCIQLLENVEGDATNDEDRRAFKATVVHPASMRLVANLDVARSVWNVTQNLERTVGIREKGEEAPVKDFEALTKSYRKFVETARLGLGIDE